jgi:hypothetical protein
VADSLSRDFHIPSDTLSHLLSISFPKQVPFVTFLDPLVVTLCGRKVGQGSNLFYLLVRQG